MLFNYEISNEHLYQYEVLQSDALCNTLSFKGNHDTLCGDFSITILSSRFVRDCILLSSNDWSITIEKNQFVFSLQAQFVLYTTFSKKKPTLHQGTNYHVLWKVDNRNKVVYFVINDSIVSTTLLRGDIQLDSLVFLYTPMHVNFASDVKFGKEFLNLDFDNITVRQILEEILQNCASIQDEVSQFLDDTASFFDVDDCISRSEIFEIQKLIFKLDVFMLMHMSEYQTEEQNMYLLIKCMLDTFVPATLTHASMPTTEIVASFAEPD